MSWVIAIIERRRLDFYLPIRIGIISRFSNAVRIIVATMAALRRVVIFVRVITSVRCITPVVVIMMIVLMILITIVTLMMRHMKADSPVIVMMMRYRSRHQHDKYRYYNG